MASQTKPRPRYPLPEVWEPEDDWCVLIKIPAHIDFMTTLVTQLRALSFSSQFQRDDTATGAAIVARRWDSALFSEPITIIDCGDIMSFDMRVKQGQPWITEVSTDGGLTWHDAIIQPHWEGGIVGPSMPDRHAAQDMAAGIFNDFYKRISQMIIDALAAGQTRGQTVGQINGDLSPYAAGADLIPLIESAYDAFAGLDSTAQAATVDDCTYGEQFSYLANLLWNNAGRFNEVINNAIIHYVNNSIDDFNQALSRLAQALGSSGLWNNVLNHGGTAGGDDFAITCPFVHTFDLLASPRGWTAIHPCDNVLDDISGSWSETNGFVSTPSTLAPTFDKIMIESPYSAIVDPLITHYEVFYEFSGGSSNLVELWSNECEYLSVNATPGAGAGSLVFTSGGTPLSKLQAYLRCPIADTGKITAVYVEGLGPIDPWSEY